MNRIHIFFVLLLSCAITSQVLSQGTEPVEKKKEVKTNLPVGFGDIQWGTPIKEAKNKVIGKIVYTDDKRKVISKEGDIEYQYGFFFIDPAFSEQVSSNTPEEAGTSAEASLFYVSIRFSYLAKDDVLKKIQDKYGAPSGEDLVRNQGAIIWNSENTSIIMWVDSYEGKPFCKKINYISKEIAAKINEYQRKVFSAKEIEILKKLSI